MSKEMLKAIKLKWLRDQREACPNVQGRAELKRKFRGQRNLEIKSRRGSN
jgi:hypothetical protein